MTNGPTFFDIECGALPEEQIAHLMPEFSAPANYKDPLKIEAYIAEQKAKWLSEGALSPLTGEVLCIGTLRGEEFKLWEAPSEQQLLTDWFAFVHDQLRTGRLLCGFYCKSFDMPYTVKRAFKHGIHVPWSVFYGPRNYINDLVVDVAEKWSCGSRDSRDHISLDSLAKFLDIGAKNGEGKDFAELWKTDKPKAIEYLRNDLALTQACYQRMI